MKEYNYEEINRMQKAALERVRNMQIKSENAVKGTENENISQLREKFYSTISEAPKTAHIPMPNNIPERKEEKYRSFDDVFSDANKASAPGNTVEPPAVISDIFRDPDKSLLLALALLLKADGAGEDLLMALLYIML